MRRKKERPLTFEVGDKKGREKTVDIFDVGVPLELKRELIEVPDAHLRLVCPVARTWWPSRVLFIRLLASLNVLYELDGALHALANRALSLRFRRTFPHELVRERETQIPQRYH